MRMNIGNFLLGIAASVAAAAPAFAYEGETHVVITAQAYGRSALAGSGPGSLREALGLDRFSDVAPFYLYWKDSGQREDAYYDSTALEDSTSYPFAYPGLEYLRLPTMFEQCQFENLALVGWLQPNEAYGKSIMGWLMRGVTREDDIDWGWRNVFQAQTSCGSYENDIDPHGAYTRVYNHFYDPIHDIPLKFSGLEVGMKNVDWALGYQDSFASAPVRNPDRRNHFTYADARDNQWIALTGGRNSTDLPYDAGKRDDDARERLRRWATTFRALGDVIHLLQDSAQPQHVRNDAHSGNTSLQQQAFEGYTNARVFGGGALNAYVLGFFETGTQVPLPVIVLGNYPLPAFATARRYFTTRAAGDGAQVLPDDRHGMADYSNRGFFTGGTKPGDTAGVFQRPPQQVDAANGYVRSEQPCLNLSMDLDLLSIRPQCTHWMHEVPDTIAPGYADVLPHNFGEPSPFSAPPLLAESVLATALPGEIPSNRYMIGIEELQTIANLTIPRAVGYSAGFINYFFRGRLELSSPPDGLYAVGDQGGEHHVDGGVPVADSGNLTYGFKKLRVRVKNITGDILESGAGPLVSQRLVGDTNERGGPTGHLVAIARYHRNPCYKTDLSGEYITKVDTDGVPQGSTAPDCGNEGVRTKAPEISVSKGIRIDANGNLVAAPAGSESACANVGNINTGVASGDCSNAAALLEFDFSNDPIPVNAVDVFLQVAYRGRIGEEEDGIAVGSKDISEPQYFTFWNNTDWFLVHDQWKRPEDIPVGTPDAQAAQEEDVTEVMLCFNQQLIAHLRSPQRLAPKQFVRVAVLADTGDINIGAISRDEEGNAGTATDGPYPGMVRQSAKEELAAPWIIDPMFSGRGTTLGQGLAMFNHYSVEESWSYNFEKVQYLEPALNGRDVGVPLAFSDLHFTGKPDETCEQYFPDAGGASRGTAALRRAGVGRGPGMNSGRAGRHP